ncbi:MAG: hypothetical protein EBS05_23605 [Proteobacteria bacterium]|nr:hypothetical protein [Pseudomonadota bacterium]NDF01552.1 hypothetical protein [Verrucomicrobiota bacterium]
MVKGKGAAEVAIGEIHQQFNDTKFAAIYTGGHAKLKKASPEKQFVELMEAVHRKLGKVTDTKNTGWRINTFNLTTTVLMQQQTTFERGKGVESFTFEMDGEKAVLVGYFINSNDLILK